MDEAVLAEVGLLGVCAMILHRFGCVLHFPLFHTVF